MRHILALLLALFLFGCENTDIGLMADAALDTVKAVTLTNEQVTAISRRAALASDGKNRVAPEGSAYSQRLRRLIAGHEKRDGRDFNYKVYLADIPNAFAMADGSIRINSGLMDIMTDEEILFILGHEMGHVVKNHSRKQLILALSASAVRKGLAAQDSEVGQIAASMIGAFSEQLANAQFSQHEERQADSYGAAFLEDIGGDRSAAVSALNKLATLAGRHTFLSSHPHPESRAKRLLSAKTADPDEMPSEDHAEASLFDKTRALLTSLWRQVLAVLQQYG
ncbi:M48 family metalloprotease [Desulfovibrio sulfodismutans]|uniref:M48 family metalloprotease n=1 Tax=Desulfolutivibrio sulfodismutans TaxID=63561 RepID=A0A7K3NQB7_9BACT|nr:M48 family metalloprotease [Desulfolutivibrio sulfodismutans]NDY58394.1 M48 family metalloprotease [Desulfolutivibrio sulfodismutans]QLA13477.1 M48 family metalloprotease [Desulfolutivibrio sulfodismutans DSM 3696]